MGGIWEGQGVGWGARSLSDEGIASRSLVLLDTGGTVSIGTHQTRSRGQIWRR